MSLCEVAYRAISPDLFRISTFSLIKEFQTFILRTCFCRFFVVWIPCILFASCNSPLDIKPIWQGKKSLALERLLSIGTDDVELENYIFGLICDIEIDKHGNIYVFDAGLFRIQKYGSDGTYMRSFGNGHGMKDGQFLRPKRIAFDSNGNLYALDFELRKITVFDSIGENVRKIKVPMMPSHIAIDRDDNIYVIGDPRTYKGPLIHKYHKDGLFLASFCSRNGVHKLALRSGNHGWITTDKTGNVYYTLSYPYEIRKFSPDGKLLRRITRPTPSFKAPYKVSRKLNDKVLMRSGTVDLLILPNGNIVNLIYHREPHRTGVYPDLRLDLFSPQGDWLLNLPLKSLGIERYGPMEIDDSGNFYISQGNPNPRVVKYSISVVDNNEK